MLEKHTIYLMIMVYNVMRYESRSRNTMTFYFKVKMIGICETH